MSSLELTAGRDPDGNTQLSPRAPPGETAPCRFFEISFVASLTSSVADAPTPLSCKHTRRVSYKLASVRRGRGLAGDLNVGRGPLFFSGPGRDMGQEVRPQENDVWGTGSLMAWYKEEHYEAPVSESPFYPEKLKHLRCHQILRYDYPRRTAVPRGSLRVHSTLALPVLGTLKGYRV